MSIVKVNAITDLSGGNTATINSMTPTADSLQGFRNRIINGDMRIDQRNAGASVTPSTGTYTLDRWRAYSQNGSAFTVQQSTDAPAGFVNSLKVTSAAATTPGSFDYYFIQQAFEGFNVADFDFGKASAKTVTLSFWVKSSLTGQFGGAFTNAVINRSYAFTYTISSANTWEQKTITVSGDTTGTWATGNTSGLNLYFDMGLGSGLITTAGSWTAGEYRGATGDTKVVGTNGATFYITGVQLEVGSVATPFERRDYGRELAMCQRYYQKVEAQATFAGRGFSSTEVLLGIPLNVSLRASPTLSDGGTTFLYSGGARVNSTGGTLTVTSYDTETTNIAAVRGGFTITDDRIYNAIFSSNVTISAEL